MPAVQPLTLSAAAAGRLLGVGKNKVLALIHSGALPAVILGKRIRVRRADLDIFLASLPSVTDMMPADYRKARAAVLASRLAPDAA
jgi:excisionase family DNA binding protein